MCFAQRLRNLVLPVVLQLQEVGLRFADDLLGARYLRGDLAPPPLDIGRFPFEIEQARTSLEPLLHESGDGGRLVPDDANAFGGGGCLCPEAIDLLFNLQPLFAIDRDLRLKDLPARLEDILLARKHVRDRRALLVRRLQFGGKRHPLVPALFCGQSRFARERIPQLTFEALDLRAGFGVFQGNQYLSRVDEIAVGDQDFPDDAALEVLNGLSARLGFDGAGGNRSTLEWCKG